MKREPVQPNRAGAVVVLVGRVNVGKSTLFNRLTHTRSALVADYPGLTRDRLVGHARWGRHHFILVDTGGFDESGHTLAGRVSEQSLAAAGEADAIILVVDGRAGLSALDQRLAQQLRRAGKTLLVAVNKTEGLDGDLACLEFHALGLHALPVSALRGSGVGALIEALAEVFERTAQPVSLPPDVPRVAFAGRPNSGKSTLVNALLGEQRVMVADQPGTTRDAVDIHLCRDGRNYVLVDTAGVRRRARIAEKIEADSVVAALRAIEQANVVVVVLDARREISTQDLTLLSYVLEAGRAMVLVVNKWDGLDRDERRQIRAQLDRRLTFLHVTQPRFISALHGSGVGELFPAIDRALASAGRRLPTSMLNRILARAVERTPPPRHQGRPVTLKFAHQCGTNPPRIRIHGNQVRHVSPSYRRYLAGAFRSECRLEGTPVVIEFRQATNPYTARSARRRS